MSTVSSDRRSGGDRRREPTRLFRERRSGFDRREPAPGWLKIMTAYRRNTRLVWLVLALITALNLGDIVFTQVALAGGAVEGNPFLAPLIESNFMLATILKSVVVGVVVSMIWAARRYRIVLEFSLVVLAIFASVFVYHVLNSGEYWARLG